MPCKYSKDLYYFTNINLETCYWAGFIAADGNVNIDRGRYRLSVALKREDKDHVQSLADSLGYTGPLRDGCTKMKYKGEQRVYPYSSLCVLGVKQWMADLHENYNIGPNKSLSLEPPRLLDNDLILSFMKGYFDGDGTLYFDNRYQRPTIRIGVLGTHSFLSWFKSQTNKHVKNDNKIEKTASQAYCYRLSSKKAIHFLAKLDEIPTPKLARKWKLYHDYITAHPSPLEVEQHGCLALSA